MQISSAFSSATKKNSGPSHGGTKTIEQITGTEPFRGCLPCVAPRPASTSASPGCSASAGPGAPPFGECRAPFASLWPCTFAATAATFSVAAVFLPVVFVRGLVGSFLGEFGVTVAGSGDMVVAKCIFTMGPGYLAITMTPPPVAAAVAVGGEVLSNKLEHLLVDNPPVPHHLTGEGDGERRTGGGAPHERL